MKNSTIVLVVCICLIVVSCKKQIISGPIEPSLAGQWLMVLYIDSTVQVAETKEDSYLHFNPFMSSTPYPSVGDVKMKITFDDSNELTGKIQGNTLFNGFDINFSRTYNNEFSYNAGNWSLALDPPWGQYFYNCIQTATSYAFDSELRLLINSPTKTIVFVRE